MLETVPTSDAASSAVPEVAEAAVDGDAYVDQLRTLLRKATDRARAAEQATEAVQRELASVRARLAEELASSAIVTEMAGEAERRAMKAEATAEALRAHLAGEHPPVGQQAAGVVLVTPSARQTLEGLVRELHGPPAPVEAVVPDVAASSGGDAEPAISQAEPAVPEAALTPIVTARQALATPADQPPVEAAQPKPGGTVTILPTASSRRRWSR